MKDPEESESNSQPLGAASTAASVLTGVSDTVQSAKKDPPNKNGPAKESENTEKKKVSK